MIDGKGIFEKLKGKGGRLIFFIGIVGIALIFLSSFLPKEAESEPVAAIPEADSYCLTLEEKIKELVKSITGSERISVAVTLECGRQYVYADEGKSSENGQKNDTQQSYAIIKGADGEESGLLVTEYMPTVRGVAIVCDAFSDDTKERVLSAVCAALDISEKKIFVTQYA